MFIKKGLGKTNSLFSIFFVRFQCYIFKWKIRWNYVTTYYWQWL